MGIEAVLFDADGVIQKPAETRPLRWSSFLGSPSDLDGFLGDVFAAEEPAIDGQSNFVEAFQEILSRWKWRGTVDDALEAWTMIEPNEEIFDTIKVVREMGVTCHLATNQESHRARYMSETLGYRDLFDKEFYSCRMGLRKPDADYFHGILEEIEAQTENVLFIDDRLENLDGAREVGLHAVRFTLEAGPGAFRQTLRESGVTGA